MGEWRKIKRTVSKVSHGKQFPLRELGGPQEEFKGLPRNLGGPLTAFKGPWRKLEWP